MSRSFPQTRLRRNRTDSWLRELLKEHYLTVNDLVLPLFVQEGEKQKTAIKALPDIYRLSIDLLLAEIKLAIKYGIKAIALFPVIEEKFKTIDAREAYNHNNLICRAIKAIKAEYQDQIGIIADVALDPYNKLGHDGLVKNGKVLNDETIKILAKQALTLAAAGADIIAPSDMMDGRIGHIRAELDKANFTEVKILSYAVKFSSNFYGPFRDAVGSSENLNSANKDSYQMSFANSSEYLAEVELDVNEGADMIMVKPAISYLDVMQKVKEKFSIPVFAYHVSGEYAYLKAAAEKNYLDYDKTLVESLIACKRAGANAIFCYDSLNIAKKLHNNKLV